jgi:hypothetical protein
VNYSYTLPILISAIEILVKKVDLGAGSVENQTIFPTSVCYSIGLLYDFGNSKLIYSMAFILFIGDVERDVN